MGDRVLRNKAYPMMPHAEGSELATLLKEVMQLADEVKAQSHSAQASAQCNASAHVSSFPMPQEPRALPAAASWMIGLVALYDACHPRCLISALSLPVLVAGVLLFFLSKIDKGMLLSDTVASLLLLVILLFVFCTGAREEMGLGTGRPLRAMIATFLPFSIMILCFLALAWGGAIFLDAIAKEGWHSPADMPFVVYLAIFVASILSFFLLPSLGLRNVAGALTNGEDWEMCCNISNEKRFLGLSTIAVAPAFAILPFFLGWFELAISVADWLVPIASADWLAYYLFHVFYLQLWALPPLIGSLALSKALVRFRNTL